jgi:hypothetical protein
LASKALEDAIDAYLAANWTTTPIFTENEQGEIPADAGAFIILQFPVANVERVSPAARLYREGGAFRIVINVPRGAGTSLIRQYGSDLADIFRDVRVGDVDCRAAGEPFTDDESDRGLYFTGSLTVPFDRYFRK